MRKPGCASALFSWSCTSVILPLTAGSPLSRAR
jgi:hypothetical protein